MSSTPSLPRTSDLIGTNIDNHRRQLISERWYSAQISTADRCAEKVGTNGTSDGHTRDSNPHFFEEAQPGILCAAAQYGVRERILDLCTFDITRNPWRCGGLFDAIITDPPCKLSYPQNRCEHNSQSPSDSSSLDGVRAGAKRLGRKKERAADPPHPARPREYVFGRAIRYSSVTPQVVSFYFARDDDQPYVVPPTKPYELSALAADLVVLARYLLKPGGRLVFFLPTVIDEYKALDLDSLLCDGMQVIANSLQDFGAWGRRVRRQTPFSLRTLLACILIAVFFLSSSQSARPRLNRTLRRRSIRTVVNQRRETSRLFPSTSPPIATFARSTFRGLEDRRLTFDHQTLLYLVVNLQWIAVPAHDPLCQSSAS